VVLCLSFRPGFHRDAESLSDGFGDRKRRLCGNSRRLSQGSKVAALSQLVTGLLADPKSTLGSALGQPT
jgi:hypothetical protein